MSINLIFEVKGGGVVDFPFQTPTKLTNAVLNAPSIEQKLHLIDEYLITLNLYEDQFDDIRESIVQLMENPNLTLSCI